MSQSKPSTERSVDQLPSKSRYRGARRVGWVRALAPVLVLAAGAATLTARAAAVPVARELIAHGLTAASAAPPATSPAVRGVKVPRQLAREAANRSAAGTSRRAASRRKPAKPTLHGDPLRAKLAFDAMQRYDYILGSGLYTGEPFATLWDFSQALAATVSLANVPALRQSLRHEINARLIGLAAYLDSDNSGEPEGTYTSTLPAFDGLVAPPAGPGGAKFYDDNDWIGIELVRIYKLTRDARALGWAKGIMEFEMAGWQTDPTLACPGGIPFNNTAEDDTRNAVTDAPGVELGVQLFRATGDAAYLQFAEMAYSWVRRCLLMPSGLYADDISRKGRVEQTAWSYNQGTMIGAGTLLYQATGNAAYLYDARHTAHAALTYFTQERLRAETPFFPSVYFRNLLYLDSVTHDPPGPALARTYANYMWARARMQNNLFVWGSPPSSQLLVQGSIAQIYALLSSSAKSYF